MNSDYNIYEVSKDIMTRYEALQRENIALKAELADLKAKLMQDEKPPNKQLTVPPSSPQKSFVKGLSNALFQIKNLKTSIHVDWLPIPYDFSDSVLSLYTCNMDQQNICCFGTADSRISIFKLDLSNPDEKGTSLVNSNNFNSKLIAYYEGHHGAINCIIQDPNSGLFASTSGDGSTHVWSLPPIQSTTGNVSTGRYRDESNEPRITTNIILQNHNGPVLGASWADEALYTISGTNVSSWNITRTRRILTEDLGSTSLSIDSLDGSMIGIGLISGEVKLLDPRDEAGIHRLFYEKESDAVISLKFLDNFLITACADKTIKKIDVRNGSKVMDFEIDHIPTKIDVNGNMVLVPIEDGKTRIINLNTEYTYVFDSNPFSYTTSCARWIDDNSVLCASWDGSASVAQFPMI